MHQAYSAIVIATGHSRHEQFRPLERMEGLTALEHAVGCFRRAGVEDIVIVVGRRAFEVADVCAKLAAPAVYCEGFQNGLSPALRSGARALQGWTEGVFVMPADTTVVAPATVMYLAERLEHSGAALATPTHNGMRGQPLCLARAALEEMLAAGPTFDFHASLAALADREVLVETPDPGVVLEMDDPAAYARVLTQGMDFSSAAATA